MGIFSRLSDIINSNISATLDRAEDPAKMIRMMIQEMEDTLVEVRSTAARAIADRKELTRRLGRLGEAQAEWERKARLAVSKGREDLAKGALLEKAKLAETGKAMEDEVERLDEAMARHADDIAKLETKLREVKAKREAIEARHEVASSQLNVRRQVHDGRIDEAFKRFEQMERRLDDAEGRVEAFDLGRGKTLADEIAELEAEQTIDAELARLRSETGADRKEG